MKRVSTSDEVNSLMRELTKVRNDDSMWELVEETIGNNVEVRLRAASELDRIMGTTIDSFAAMSVWMNGNKVRTLWTKGF